MDRDDITVASATGVEVTFEVAGAGSRSFAFVIDWLIRLVVALAWFAAVGLLVVGHVLPEGKDADSDRYFMWALLPALGIYLLYHPALEMLLRGRTPGKRIAGIRLVTTGGATPPVGAILIRNFFRLIDGLPLFYIVGLLCAFFTAKRVRIGDLAAGTLLVRDRGDALGDLVALGTLAGQSPLDTTALEVARDLLERWRALDEPQRAVLARAFLARVEPGSAPLALAQLGTEELRARIGLLVPGAAT